MPRLWPCRNHAEYTSDLVDDPIALDAVTANGATNASLGFAQHLSARADDPTITYGEREKRGFLQTTGLSLAFTVGAVLVAIIASAAISAMSLIGTWILVPPFAGMIITAALWLGTAIVASGLVAVIYRYGPAREDAKWMWLTPGAVFASVGAPVATFLFGFYISHFASYNATYGALGAVVSFLMWLYVTAFVVLFGAELNAKFERQTAEDRTIGPQCR